MVDVAVVLEVVCWHGEECFYCTVRDGRGCSGVGSVCSGGGWGGRGGGRFRDFISRLDSAILSQLAFPG